jgi:phytoene synthase
MRNQSEFDAARQICKQHARSFYFSSFFLPVPKRNAAYAVYAFCRLLDDATDEASSPREVAGEIDRFVALLEEVYGAAGNPKSENRNPKEIPNPKSELKNATTSSSQAGCEGAPEGPDSLAFDPALRGYPQNRLVRDEMALRAFAMTVRQYDIPQSCFLEIAEGCRMDLTISRYQTWEDLRKYCYRVAGVVGVIMSRVFGLDDPAVEAQAIMMGEAMQLTNILRDVKEDAERGRIYLPLEDLERFGYAEHDLMCGVVNEPFRLLMKFEIDRARQLYRTGAEGLSHLADDGSRFTATAMGVIYAGILRAIEKLDYDVFSSRARLTLPQKLLRLPAARRISRGGTVADAF